MIIRRNGNVPVQVSKQVANDRSLSLEAKGLMVILCSTEEVLDSGDLWSFTSSRESEIGDAFAELVDRGYIEGCDGKLTD